MTKILPIENHDYDIFWENSQNCLIFIVNILYMDRNYDNISKPAFLANPFLWAALNEAFSEVLTYCGLSLLQNHRSVRPQRYLDLILGSVLVIRYWQSDEPDVTGRCLLSKQEHGSGDSLKRSFVFDAFTLMTASRWSCFYSTVHNISLLSLHRRRDDLSGLTAQPITSRAL